MSSLIKNLIPRKKITIPDIAQVAINAQETLAKVRQVILAPKLTKKPPSYTLGQVAALGETLGISKAKIIYQIKKQGLETKETSTRRQFSVADTQKIIRTYREEYQKPEGARAVTIAVGNFKGGVSKTTTTMSLAQCLSLRGHKVLCLDMDPQGSLTSLFGILPDTEVSEEQTFARVFIEDEVGNPLSLSDAVVSTYWENIDLIPANTALYNAEFILPAKQMGEPDFKFWNVLNSQLDEIRERYDIILIDTPPSLSYLTINAFMASEGLIVPLPPNNLDFASSVSFWNLFSDLSSNLMANGMDKSFDFLHILLARVDSQDVSSSVVSEWIQATYREKVLPVEIPKTTVTVAASAEFGTVYDYSKYPGNALTYRRAREAYDRVGDLIEQSIVSSWHQQIADVEE